jgi:HlyD family secretion protein
VDARVIERPVPAERPPGPIAEPRGAPSGQLPPDASQRSRRMHLPSRLTIAAILLAALAAGASWWYLTPRAQVAYVSAKVSRGPVAPYITASGSVNPVVTVQVGTYVSGVILNLYCDFNTRVKAGQLCAKIDPRPYQVLVDQDTAALAGEQAQLLKDQASLAYATLNYERQARLLAASLTSKDAVDLARSANDQARAQVGLDRATIAERRAALAAANVNLGYTNITSPVDGTVVSRNITQGQTVAASFQTPTLFLIATDLTHMQVDASVSESDIGSIEPGSMASFSVEAFPARVFHGRVVQVRQSPQTIQNVVTYDVVVQADNPQLLLKPGMTADVKIVTAEAANALRVPIEALRYWPEGIPKPAQTGAAPAQVWTLRDGRPVAVAVVVGLTDDAYGQIERGALAAGDAVIIGERATGSSSAAAAPANRPRAPFL